MNSLGTLAIGALLLSTPALAHESSTASESGRLTLPDLRYLEKQATESTVVTLGPWLLHFASHFADKKDPQGAVTRRLLARLKSVSIHSYEFDRDNVYSQADVDAVRQQLASPEWSRVARMRSKDRENVDVYVATDGEQTTGIALISSEPRELTIVNIVGPIDPDDLQQVTAQLNLPGVALAKADTP